MQPDSIIPDQTNPQSWNRFGYVRNNPILFNDPTGHREYCDGEYLGSCKDWAGSLTYNNKKANKKETKDLDFSGYTDWEREVITNIMNSGQTGYDMGMYILSNDVHISFDEMIEGNGAQWRIVNGQQFIVLNNATYSENSSTLDPFMLQNIAHEAKHLEQGPKVALSVFGEQQAWQTGIQVYMDLGEEPSYWSKKIHDLPLNYNPVNLIRADFYMQMRGGIGYPIWILQLYPSPIGAAYLYYLLTSK